MNLDCSLVASAAEERYPPIAGLIQMAIRIRLRREVERALKSEELVEVIRNAVAAQVNSAVTSHLRRGSFRQLVTRIVAEVLAGAHPTARPQ